MCTLEFMCLYMYTLMHILKVRVKRAEDIKASDFHLTTAASSDPYVKIKLSDEDESHYQRYISLYIHTHIYMNTYMYIYVYIYIYIYVCILYYIHIFVHAHAYTCNSYD